MRVQRLKWKLLSALIMSAIVVWGAVLEREPSGVLTVSFLDVGQGDAIFVEGPTGSQVLIDAGKGRAVLRGLGEEMSFFDRTIDVVVATHPDFDHIGGFPEVFERYEILKVVETGNGEGQDDYKAFTDKVKAEGSKHVLVKRGHIINLGDEAYLRVLFPDGDVTAFEANSASIVLQLVYGETAFMLTGDAPAAVEKYVMELDGETLKSNVLKAGHHGSSTSNDELFVGIVGPEYAVVSAECDSRYGHPHEEVLETFEKFEVEVLSTCEHGTVTFVSDGESVILQ